MNLQELQKQIINKQLNNIYIFIRRRNSGTKNIYK